MTKNGIVVVTYNRLELLKICLQNIKKQTVLFDEVIVVDNCSNDGTGEYLDKEKDISVLHIKKNLGGAGGFAKGIYKAKELGCNWITLIDDDAIISQNFLSEILYQRKEHPELKAYCARVCTNGRTMLQFARRLIDDPNNQEIHVWNVPISEYNESLIMCDLATFCGLTFSSDLIAKIGYPEERFFISHDDTEYCLRMRKNGYRIGVVTNAVIDHRTKPTPSGNNWKTYYSARNQICELKKHFGVKYAWKKTQGYITQINRYVNDNPTVAVLKGMYRRAVIDAWLGRMGKRL